MTQGIDYLDEGKHLFDGFRFGFMERAVRSSLFRPAWHILR